MKYRVAYEITIGGFVIVDASTKEEAEGKIRRDAEEYLELIQDSIVDHTSDSVTVHRIEAHEAEGPWAR